MSLSRQKTGLGRAAPQPTWFWLFAVALLLLRFLHFQQEIDDPHSWRQCDTAHYIWSMYQEGIDPFHPKVAWMGGYKLTALEFPLPQAVIATIWKILGPHMFWARLLDLSAFLVAALYLFLIIRKISSEDVARFATLIFMAVPLSLFYSRAIHIDFWAIALAHGMAWYALLAIDGGHRGAALKTVACATLVFAIKAPYAFYFGLPLFAYAWRQDRLRASAKLVPLAIFPIVAFLAWRFHAHTLNAAAPDWPWLPGYHKFVNMSGWYFGPFEMRLHWEPWRVLIERLLGEAPGWPVLLAGLPALFLRSRGLPFCLVWLAGVFIYTTAFFNLSVVHNYYQLPLIAPFAMLAGIGLAHLQSYGSSLGVSALLLISLISVRYAELHYYSIAPQPVEAGQLIREHTPENDLVIVSYGGLDVRAPHILFRARRYGWSVPARDVSIPLIDHLRDEGAKWLCTLRPGPPPADVVKQSLSGPCLERKISTGELLSICPL